MKYAIITPTFSGHFCYIPDYLKSFVKNMKDPDQVDFVFVIEQDSAKSFQKIIEPFCKKLQIKTFYLEEILNSFHVEMTPQEIMEKYGRFTYQTFKKMYGMLYADYDYYLVLDSESILLRSTKVSELFEKFFKNPFIAGSKFDPKRRVSQDFNLMKKNIDSLLDFQMPFWLLEHFMWFYDIKILKQLFKDYGNLSQMAHKIAQINKDIDTNPNIKFGIFEICLYQNYLYKNRQKFGYTFYDIDDILKERLSSEIREKYEDLFYNRFKGSCGLLEHAVLFLNVQNFRPLASVFKELNFQINRCDETTTDNYALQKQFLKIVQPVILAASQNHYFGVKHTKKQLLKIISGQKNITKLKKHIQAFLSPIFLIIKWVLRPVVILKYIIKILIDSIKNLLKML